MSDTVFRKLNDGISVSPQLDVEDFARARADGFATVINNRPDGEAADQISSGDAAEAAAAQGLAYIHVPVVSGGLTMQDVIVMRDALAGAAKPVLAYCRTGTRSCNVWALASAADQPAEELVDIAARAGYDLSAIRGLLRQINRAG